MVSLAQRLLMSGQSAPGDSPIVWTGPNSIHSDIYQIPKFGLSALTLRANGTAVYTWTAGSSGGGHIQNNGSANWLRDPEAGAGFDYEVKIDTTTSPSIMVYPIPDEPPIELDGYWNLGVDRMFKLERQANTRETEIQTLQFEIRHKLNPTITHTFFVTFSVTQWGQL